MTDDTLREECVEFVSRLIREAYCTEDTMKLVLAFARAQQAKGMKEALRMVDEQRAEDSRRWALFRCEVKAQAMARVKP